MLFSPRKQYKTISDWKHGYAKQSLCSNYMDWMTDYLAFSHQYSWSNTPSSKNYKEKKRSKKIYKTSDYLSVKQMDDSWPRKDWKDYK